MPNRPARKRWCLRTGSLLLVIVACSDLLTTSPDPTDILDGPVDGLSPAERAAFVRGDAEFGRRFSPATGLGPLFNDAACAECHSGDGRGRPENALARIGTPADGMLRLLGGPQIQDRAIPGAVPEPMPEGVAISLRLPPPVFGVGLIEAIPESGILARADADDADGDGISGRPNWVVPPPWVPATEPGSGPGPRLGRFSRKAQVSSILQQTTEAYLQDMGITSDFLPVENRNALTSHPHDAADMVPDPEIPASTVFAVVNYLRMLAPPGPGEMTPAREQGQLLFTTIGCAACHTPVLHTGPSRIAALSNKPVSLYSDLLLHDMGDALADDRPDGDATGREWRTTPLWGLRLLRVFLNGDAFLLHDGRARTIEEAILLHGGEAQQSRDLFHNLAPADRAALVDFVGSR
ncbi:MAG TPA: di-heme oxidoredictase family protein [Gemmatimonadaceae bacterium]